MKLISNSIGPPLFPLRCVTFLVIGHCSEIGNKCKITYWTWCRQHDDRGATLSTSDGVRPCRNIDTKDWILPAEKYGAVINRTELSSNAVGGELLASPRLNATHRPMRLGRFRKGRGRKGCQAQPLYAPNSS